MKVIKKQKNSLYCLICGMDNSLGVKAQFYVLENEMVCSLFQYDFRHQSYPERVHGGMITAMLDELGCRAYWAKYQEDTSAVTLSITTKFRKPVPYNIPLKGLGKIIKDTPRYFDAECGLYNEEGICLANATMRYLKIPIETVCDRTFEEEMPYYLEDEITEIDISNIPYAI